MQRQADAVAETGATGGVHEPVEEPSLGTGQALDATTRRFFEPRFGYDFSQVRVHTDAAANASASGVNALAYTLGRDLVFGAGQYAPETAAGRRLLAHELTHVVQQTGSNAAALQQRTPVIQRQPPPAPAGPQPWAQCNTSEIGNLNAELAEASSWVSGAITDLQAAVRPAHTNGALGRYLSTDPAKITSTIIPKLQAIQADLGLGATNFRCQTEQQCLARFPNGANAFSGHPITLCPGYFDKNRLGRITTLIHESGHNAGLAGNVVEWQWPFAGLSETVRLGNTESYAAFVRSNHFSWLPPLQQDVGVQLGIGALFPGANLRGRFLVTAEWDVLPAQRLWRFLDLHWGFRFDVDSSGTLLGSTYLGPRLFTPVSLASVPLFVDLRGGFVLGRVADVGDRFENFRGQPINVLGPSGDFRVGVLSGNFGGSIGYRHIWNMVKDNPNLHSVSISGEVRF